MKRAEHVRIVVFMLFQGHVRQRYIFNLVGMAWGGDGGLFSLPNHPARAFYSPKNNNIPDFGTCCFFSVCHLFSLFPVILGPIHLVEYVHVHRTDHSRFG